MSAGPRAAFSKSFAGQKFALGDRISYLILQVKQIPVSGASKRVWSLRFP